MVKVVPSSITFATKPELARQMLKHVFQTQSRSIQWITADTVYGGNRSLREWLEQGKKAYVLAVSVHEVVEIGGERYRTPEFVSQTPEDAWQRLSCGNGSKGPREYDWVRYNLDHPDTSGWERRHVASVKDLFLRKIVGWHADRTMETELVLTALKRAYQHQQPTGSAFHLDPFSSSLFCLLQPEERQAQNFVLGTQEGEISHKVSQRELRWLLNGLSLYQQQAHRKVTARTLI